MTDEQLLMLWGKTDRDNPGSNRYHPLLFHLLDVGFVARELWRHGLPQSTRARIAEANRLSIEEAERVAVLLAAQHDIGKASAFQAKDSILWERVLAIGDSPSLDGAKRPHAQVTTAVLAGFAERGVGGWRGNRQQARLLARITGGHHGGFPTSLDLMDLDKKYDVVGGPAWDVIRGELLQFVDLLLYGDRPPISLISDPLHDPALLPLLGGFICAADWLASDVTRFLIADPLENPMSPGRYAVLSEQRAREAVEQTGWSIRPSWDRPAGFGEIFRDAERGPFSPNPMQQAAVRLADGAASPYLMIVEAAMGDGKTEAAFYCMDRALTTGLACGAYVAMPTMATGNAMFARFLEKYLPARNHGDLNIQLVHSGAWMNAWFEKLRLAANSPREEDREDRESRLTAEGWFVPKKQALLAPLGVGTIDQCLLGVLQTKHWFVRLFGLAGKVIIFDEVHAYDVYMVELLKRLLSWLRALDCTVIVLSATLPRKLRAELLEGWGESLPEQEQPYPRITFASGEGPVLSEPAGPSARPPLSVELGRLGCGFGTAADRLQADLPRGGCAALLCNTVTRAQEAFRTLSAALAPLGWEVLLFHARTTAEWRAEKEKEVLARFGKDGERPDRCLLIATQVAEQSLDLDFDWMASEIAPVDLVLQRMGRLWRHERIRTTDVTRFYIICDESDSSLLLWPDWTNLVYDEDILLRTTIALQPDHLASLGLLDGSGRLRIPDAIEPLVRAVYDDPPPSDLPQEWEKKLAAAVEEVSDERAKHAAQAIACLHYGPEQDIDDILEPGCLTGGIKRNLLDEDDPAIHQTMVARTRLGDQAIGVVCSGTDAHGNLLSVVPLSRPDRDQVERLLRMSVNVSSRGLVALLRKMPEPWRDDRHLRHHRLLEFTNGECRALEGYTLRLSRDLGMEIEKNGKGEEE